jgi:transcriptional regulator with XRE-family HTH domain
MTQKELADLLGITVQAYNYAETGKRTLKVKTMIQYQQIMKLDDATMWQIISQDDAED